MNPDSKPEFSWNILFIFTTLEESESGQSDRIFVFDCSEERAKRGSGFRKERASGVKQCKLSETRHDTSFSRSILFYIGALPFIVF
jgi:hypothetical protein